MTENKSCKIIHRLNQQKNMDLSKFVLQRMRTGESKLKFRLGRQ